MEVTATEMNDTLNAYLISGEKSICPVLSMIKKNTKYINKAASEFGYVTVTTLDRIIIYHFDEYASYCEYFTFDTLIMGMREADKLRELFAIPEDETIMAVIALGYRAEEPNRPERKELDEIVKFF